MCKSERATTFSRTNLVCKSVLSPLFSLNRNMSQKREPNAATFGAKPQDGTTSSWEVSPLQLSLSIGLPDKHAQVQATSKQLLTLFWMRFHQDTSGHIFPPPSYSVERMALRPEFEPKLWNVSSPAFALPPNRCWSSEDAVQLRAANEIQPLVEGDARAGGCRGYPQVRSSTRAIAASGDDFLTSHRSAIPICVLHDA